MIFYTVEIVWNYGAETKTFRFMNCLAKTTGELQDRLTDRGLRLPVSVAFDKWVVIFPFHVQTFIISRQEKFFNYAYSDSHQTVFDKEQKEIK